MIGGTHIHVSGQHLQKYVDEAVFRYNHRFKDVDMFGCLVLKLISYQDDAYPAEAIPLNTKSNNSFPSALVPI